MSTGPDHCEPIVLLGASRRQQIADRMQQAIDEWRRQWGAVPHGHLEVDVADALCRKSASSAGHAMTFGIGAEDPLLAIVVPMEAHHELLGLSAPRATADGGEIANAVLTEALRDLCSRLARMRPGATGNLTTLQGEPLAQMWARYGLSVTVRVGAERVVMRGRLFPELVLAMSPVIAAEPAEPLVSRRRAIGVESVLVNAWLGEAEVALSELANLRAGDVILLDANVTSAGYLALPDGRPLAKIRLGSASGRRAVSVVGQAPGC